MLDFQNRPPSTGWETALFPSQPARWCWVWYKPAALPHSVIAHVPPEVFTSDSGGSPAPPTLRQVAEAVGLAPEAVSGCSIYGIGFDAIQGPFPPWDAPLEPPPATADAGSAQSILTFFPHLWPRMVPGVPAAFPVAQIDGNAGSPEIFLRLEAEWNACLLLETQLAALAQQLKSTQMRVASLNRDLSIDETRAADNRDRHDWSDARRWLRDVTDRMSRFIKDYQTGMTSTAGKRLTFESIYLNYVAPRLMFPGIEQYEREFESHRKNLQNLLTNMGAAHSSALQDGERRAQLVLSRISSKSRSPRGKR